MDINQTVDKPAAMLTQSQAIKLIFTKIASTQLLIIANQHTLTIKESPLTRSHRPSVSGYDIRVNIFI